MTTNNPSFRSAMVSFVLISMLVLQLVFFAPSIHAQTVVATVHVGVSPSAIAFDVAKGEVFVANAGADTVSIISDTTNSVVATVSVGSSPYGIAYDPVKGEIFVINSNDNTVSVISDSTNTVIATIHVGLDPEGVVYDPAKG